MAEPRPEPLEDQVSDIVLNLSKGNPLLNNPKRTQVLDEIASDLRGSFLKCTVMAYGLDEIGTAEDATGLYISVDTYGTGTILILSTHTKSSITGKVDTKSKSLHGSVILNSAPYSVIAQQIFKILNINSSSYQYISLKPLTVYANTAFGNLMPAPLPEITFVHTKTNATCKIRLENYFSVQKTKLLNLYCRLDVRVWPLLMLARHWGTRFNALRSADSLDFQNYAISLLLVYFLVSKKIIPSLQDLQSVKDSGVDKPFIVNNYDLSFCTNVAVLKPAGSSSNPALQGKELRTLSIVSILKAFFSFCSTFDFKTKVVCSYLGMTFEREVFHPKSDIKNLPEHLSSYLNGVNGKNRPEKLYIGGPICLQDIFELTTNITRTVTEDEVSKFKQNCATTVEILDDVLNQTGSVVLRDAFTGKDC